MFKTCGVYQMNPEQRHVCGEANSNHDHHADRLAKLKHYGNLDVAIQTDFDQNMKSRKHFFDVAIQSDKGDNKDYGSSQSLLDVSVQTELEKIIIQSCVLLDVAIQTEIQTAKTKGNTACLLDVAMQTEPVVKDCPRSPLHVAIQTEIKQGKYQVEALLDVGIQTDSDNKDNSQQTEIVTIGTDVAIQTECIAMETKTRTRHMAVQADNNDNTQKDVETQTVLVTIGTDVDMQTKCVVMETNIRTRHMAMQTDYIYSQLNVATETLSVCKKDVYSQTVNLCDGAKPTNAVAEYSEVTIQTAGKQTNASSSKVIIRDGPMYTKEPDGFIEMEYYTRVHL